MLSRGGALAFCWWPDVVPMTLQQAVLTFTSCLIVSQSGPSAVVLFSFHMFFLSSHRKSCDDRACAAGKAPPLNTI